MARAHAVIASHTTVGAAARRRPITRACLLGLLASWWSWASGASWAEAAPDLVGASLRVIEAYGSNARVEWIGRNQGPDATAGAWADYVYISPRSACCAEAIFLGAFGWPQSAAVAPGATYTQEAIVHIPPLPLGNYYLIARVNASRSFAETNTANNDVATPFRIAPHVDLSPIALTAPASATTQQSISVSWTVYNFVHPFPEDATADLWQDNLYISASPTCCEGAIFLGSWSHAGGLTLGERYTQTQTVTVPDLPAGDYYVIVSVDVTDAQAEIDEDNAISTRIQVTTPDLVPTSLRAPGASVVASAQQVLSASWMVSNQGTGPTLASWQDTLYISPSPTCCAGAMPLGTWPSPTALAPHASYQQTKSITVPTLAAGSYYLIVWTNATGSLHEEDDDNSRLAIPLTITTSDLVPTALSAPASAVTGQGITVSWTVKNAGTGPTLGTWADTLHLSPTPTCCAGATLLGRWERTALAAGASYVQTKGLTVPNLVAGGYHLILRTDVDDTVFEASEANNERAMPVAITTPDLVPIALAAPAAATTQQAITVSWTVKNQGTAATARTWTDNLYLAPTSSCCAGAILLGQWTWPTSVAAGGTYTQTKSVILPGVAAGGYQLILQADAGTVLHEMQEGNNQRAVAIAVTTPDLIPTALTAPAAAEAGRAVSLSWTVRNQGTGPASGAWADKVYVSASPTCCAGTTSLGSWARPAALAAGASYAQTKSVTLPPLAAGTYYLTVWTDADGQIHEASDANNQRAVTVAVSSATVPPPAVLAVASVNGGGDPTAAAAFPVVVQARDLGGISRNVKAATPVRLSLKTGTGTLGGNLTGTIPAGASQVTITGVTYRKAESGVALTATRSGGDVLTAGTSAPFAVTPGPVAAYTVDLASPAPAGTAFAVTVTARDQFANPVAADSSTVVTLRSASGHVLFDADADGVFGDAARALTGGVLRASAQGTAAETTSVTATDAAGKTGVTALTITAGAASALAFTKQPSSVPAGGAIPGPPTVAVRDAFGNAVASTAAITIAIGANPGQASLGGSTSKNAIAGVATFSNLTISQAGSGYTLSATASGLSPATSATFAITSSSGGIAGRVTRASDGTAIGAATVQALQAGLVKGSVASALDGTYSLTGLAPGSYSVRVATAGYQAQTQTGITVAIGATAAVNFSLSAILGPTIRITSPSQGSLIDRAVVLVRGEVGSPTAAELGVSVNGTPALVGSGQFAALVAVGPGTQTLTASLSGAGVALGQDAVSVQVVPNPGAKRILLTASPRSGAAPLTVTLRAAAQGAVADYQWDADGDGVVDRSGAALNQVDVHYLTPGLYVPKVSVRDTQGAVVSEEIPILVVEHTAVVALLEAKWRELKDALRGGNVAGALQLVAESRRDRYREIFQNLTVPPSQVDLLLTDLRFVQFRDNTVELEMLRTDERGQLSYLVRFVVDVDGIWRLKDF